MSYRDPVPEKEAFVLRLVGCEMCEAYADGDHESHPHKVMEHDGTGPYGGKSPAVWHGFGEEVGECEEEDRVLEAEKLGLIRPLEVWKPRACPCGFTVYALPRARFSCPDCGQPVPRQE